MFLGLRLALNDVDDTQLLTGVIVDPEKNEKFFTLEAERRLTDHLTGELEVRLFSDAPRPSLLSAFRKDSYVQFELAYYF